MYVKEVRDIIRDTYGNGVIFLGEDGGPDCYDKSIAGVSDTCEEFRLIYDYDSIIEELMNDNGWTDEEAIEWYDCNIARAIPYAGPFGPIVMINSCQFYDDAKWLEEHNKNNGDN